MSKKILVVSKAAETQIEKINRLNYLSVILLPNKAVLNIRKPQRARPAQAFGKVLLVYSVVI